MTLKRFGISLLLVSTIILALPVLWLRGGLFQEPLATAVSTLRLEFSGNGWTTDEDSRRSIVKMQAFEMYLTYLEFEGWKQVDQMGSGYQFERESEQSMLACRQYSRRYRICSGGPKTSISLHVKPTN